jgi:tetratricopeptide (TPR) repeat protein
MGLLRAGDLKGAEVEMRQAVELAPRDPAYLGSLGAVLGMEQNLPESNVYLEKALHINPDDLATRRNLASNQFQLGQLQPAKENLERILKAKPGEPTSVLLLGMVEEELKDYVKAAKLLASVPDQVRQRPKSTAALARAFYNTGQKEKARETLEGLESHAAGPEGIFLGAQAAAQADDFETAERMFASIGSTYPDTAKLGYNLALVQYRANRIDESQTTLRKLVGAGHETSDIYNLLGWCLYKQANFKEAVAAMDQAIEIDPTRESNYLDVGMMLIELRRYPGALLASEKAVELAPDSYRAWRLKGLTEARLDRIREAQKSYARAVELNPFDEQAILGLASEQLNDGNIKEAEATLEKGIEHLPRDPALYQGYGSLLLWLGGATDASSQARAVSLLQTALRLDRSLAEPHYQLGKLAFREGKFSEALQELETAKRLDPISSKTHYELALVYRKLGRTEEADKELQTYKDLKASEGDRALGKPAGGSVLAVPAQQLSPSGPS